MIGKVVGRKLVEPLVRSRFPMTKFITTKGVFQKCTVIFFLFDSGMLPWARLQPGPE